MEEEEEGVVTTASFWNQMTADGLSSGVITVSNQQVTYTCYSNRPECKGIPSVYHDKAPKPQCSY